MASRSSQQRPEVMNSFRTPHGFFTSGPHDQQPLPPPPQQQQLHSYQHQQQPQPQPQQQQQHELPYSGLNLSFDTDFDLTLGGNLPLGHGSSHHGDTSKMPVAPTSAKPERADHKAEPKFQGTNYYGQYVIGSKNGISASTNTNHNWKPASTTTQLQGDRPIEPEYDISAYTKAYDVGATSSGNNIHEHDTPSDWVRNKNVTTPRKPVATSIDLGDDLTMARMESLLRPTMEASKPTRPAKATSLRGKRPITEPLPQQQQQQEQRQQQQQQQHQHQHQHQHQQQQQLPPQHQHQYQQHQHQYQQHQQPVLQPQRNQAQQRHDSSSDFFDASWSNPLPQAPQRPSIASSISSSSTAHVGLRNPSVFTSFTSEYSHAGAISRGASIKSSSISASPTTPTSPTSPTLSTLLYTQPPHPLMSKQAPAPSAPPVPSPTPYLPPISGAPEPHVALRASRSNSSRAPPPPPQPSVSSRRNDMSPSSNSPSPLMHPVLTSMTTAGYTSEYGGFKASDLPPSLLASSRESTSPPGGSPALDSVPTLQSFSFSAAPVQVPASAPLQVSVPNAATVPLSAPPRTTLASKTLNTSSRSRQYPEPPLPGRIDSHAQIHQQQFSYNSFPQRSSSTSIPPQQAPPPPLPPSLPQPTFEGRAHISHKSAQPAPVLTYVPAPAPPRAPSPPAAIVPESTHVAAQSQNTSHQTVPSSPWLDHDSDILRITQSQFQSQPPYPSVQLPVTTVNSHMQRQSSSRQAQREQSQSKQSQPSSQVKPLEPLDLMGEWGRPNQQRQPNPRDQFGQPIHSTPLDRIESSGRQEQSKRLNLLEDSRLQGQPKPLDLLEQLEQPDNPKPSKRVDLNELKPYSQFDLLEHIDLQEHTEGWGQPERPDPQKQEQQPVQSRQPINHLEQLDLLMQPTLQEQLKQSKRSNQSSQPKHVNQQEQLEPKVELKKDSRNELEKGLKADKKKEPKKESKKELTNEQRSEQKREQKKEPKKEQDRTKASRSSTPVQTQKKPSRSPPLDYDEVQKEPQDMESSTPPLPIKKDQQDMVPESTVNKLPPTGSSPESTVGLTAYPPPPPTILYSDDQITISSVHLTIHAFYFPLNTPVTIPLLSVTEIEVLRPEGKSGGVAGWLNYKNWSMTAALTDVWWARDPRRSATGAFTPSSILPFGFGVSAGNTPPIHVIVRVKDEWLRKGFGIKGEQGVQVLQEAWKNVKDTQQGLRPLQPTVPASLDDIEEDGAMVERPTGEHTNDGSERQRRKNQHANNTWTAYPFPNDSPVYLAQQPRRAGALLPADCGDEPELIDYDEVDEEI